MRRDVRSYLWDIQRAGDAILKFTSGLDVETYSETEIIQSAVERKFEIVGEALGQLSKLDPGLARRIPEIRHIIAFRNVLIHGYAAIEHNRVWRIAEESLPNLLAAVIALLDELDRSQAETDH